MIPIDELRSGDPDRVIAERLGIPRTTVGEHRRRAGIPCVYRASTTVVLGRRLREILARPLTTAEIREQLGADCPHPRTLRRALAEIATYSRRSLLWRLM
jgi:hypothetical protein